MASQRMPQQSGGNQGNSNCCWRQPISNRREVFPERQEPSVVHVKCDQEQNVRRSHSSDVQPDPIAPTLPPGLAANISRCKRQCAQDEQMVVVSPAHRSQAGGGQEDSTQAPKIDRSIAGMATCTLPAQHRNNARDRAGEPEQNMNPYNG